MNLAVVILAAGQGTRMKSELPKVLHRVAGRSMLGHVLQAARALNPSSIVIVTGHGAEKVEAEFKDAGVQFVRQTEQLGTGHAFLMAQPALANHTGEIMVLYGDSPMLRGETLVETVATHQKSGAGMTAITAEMQNPFGYGRIIRDEQGHVLRVVEEKAAGETEKKIKEANMGMYVFSKFGFVRAAQIGKNNAAGEYYLTDIIEMYRNSGEFVQAFKADDATEFEGCNDRVQLASAEVVLRDRVRLRHMRAGVSMMDPKSIFIDDTVEIEPDVSLYPGVILEGKTSIGRGTVVGPHSRIQNSVLATNVVVNGFTVVQDSEIGAGADIGPFARFRPGSKLHQDTHVGNFVEIKNSTLERGVKAGHLAYLGDADIGQETNIGAGTIIANYDGVNKHRTTIGAGVFVGSNSVIIAPRTLGDGSFVAAGSAVQDDVPEGALAVARGKQRNLEGWALKFWQKALASGKLKHAFIKRWLEKF